MEKKLQDNNDFNPAKYISMLYRHGRCYMDTAMNKFELGSGQYIFLLFLYKSNGTSQDEISKSLDIDKATTARAITKLEEKGFLERKVDEFDKRINRINLTQKSYDIQDEIKEFSKRWNDIILEGVTDREQEILKPLLLKISENASIYKNCKNRKGEKYD